jgi:uncharacterized protein (DUF305 family)
MRRSPLNLLLLIGLPALVLAGCSATNGEDLPAADPHANHIMEDSDSSEFGAAEIMFAQMMIPHHQQAVDMAELVPGRSENPEILQLASEIAAEQEPEIQQMQRWLEEAGAPSHMDHDMNMDGMLSEQELEQLANASGEEFERLFLEGMIKHHEGAIEMAQMIIDSKNEEARALAEAIVNSQTEEIGFMKELLANY